MRPGLASTAGRSRSRETLERRQNPDRPVERTRLDLGDRPIAAQGGEQPFAVPNRPAQSIDIDEVVTRRRARSTGRAFRDRRCRSSACVRSMYRRSAATAPSWSASHKQHNPRLRSANTPAPEPAASSSKAEAADDQSPSSAQPTACSNDSRNACATARALARERYGFFSQTETAGIRPQILKLRGDLLFFVARKPGGELEMLDRRGRDIPREPDAEPRNEASDASCERS